MLQVYHLVNSRSQRVLWLLEELELPYDIVFCTRDPITQTAPLSLQQQHLLGKVPILVDGAVALAETGAIFDYVLEQYGADRLIPVRGSAAKTQYFYWKNFAEGSFMPTLAMKQVFARMTSKSPWLLRPIFKLIQREVNARYLNPTLYQQLDTIEQQLSQSTWLAGEALSAADLLLMFMLEAACVSLVDAVRYPHISGYVQRVRSLPSYQRAVDRGQWSVATHRIYWQDA